MDFNDLNEIAQENGARSDDDVIAFVNVYNFLCDNKELVAKPRGRKNYVPLLFDRDDVNDIARRFFLGRTRKLSVSMPKTFPDPAVGVVLEEVFGMLGHTLTAQLVINHHNQAMAAENAIGSLLELYIASEMEHYGWVWCSGEVVKSVDFIKWDDALGWVPIQIKNRSNSENSSSAAVRNGTNIKKWFRSFSTKDATNWDKFPEPELVGVLTEKGFQEFIRNYFGS